MRLPRGMQISVAIPSAWMYPLVLVRTEVHITKWALICLFSTACIQLCSCAHGDSVKSEEQHPQKQTIAKVTNPEESQAQRFIPIQGGYYSGGLALDTKTGQLCRTWAWQPTVGRKDIAYSTPICKTLYDSDRDWFAMNARNNYSVDMPPLPPGAIVEHLTSVSAPDGNIYYFPDQAHADSFKKSVGIK